MKLHEIIGGVAFLLALGIVGGVENGAPLRNILLAFVFIGVFAVCVAWGDSYNNFQRRM